jgi:hypothetical protein
LRAPASGLLRCLPDGRWFDEAARTLRNRRGKPCRWPDLIEAMGLHTTASCSLPLTSTATP